jgi:hypothetical protein
MKDLYIEVLKIVNTMITQGADPREVTNQIISLYRSEVIDPLTHLLVESNEKCAPKSIPYDDYIKENHFKG